MSFKSLVVSESRKQISVNKKPFESNCLRSPLTTSANSTKGPKSWRQNFCFRRDALESGHQYLAIAFVWELKLKNIHDTQAFAGNFLTDKNILDFKSYSTFRTKSWQSAADVRIIKRTSEAKKIFICQSINKLDCLKRTRTFFSTHIRGLMSEVPFSAVDAAAFLFDLINSLFMHGSFGSHNITPLFMQRRYF